MEGNKPLGETMSWKERYPIPIFASLLISKSLPGLYHQEEFLFSWPLLFTLSSLSLAAVFRVSLCKYLNPIYVFSSFYYAEHVSSASVYIGAEQQKTP